MASGIGVGVTAQNFGWTHAGRSRRALEGLTFHIEPGERVLLAGDSGSGKSTLLAALAGVLGGSEEGHQEGEILLRSRNFSEAPGHNIPVGLLLQDPDAQVISARVGDDVAFGCENLGIEREEIWSRVEEALDLVGLDVPLDHPTERLSGGQKQRLALAGVMAMRPGLILLDEPTANLDPEGAKDIVKAVAGVAEATGVTLIVVEHQYQAWEGVLDRALLVEHGRLVADSSFAEVVETRKITGLPEAQPVAGAEPALFSRELLTRFGPPRSYELPRGHSTVITGENGAGKTTWLMTVAGLLPARGGEIGLHDAVRQGIKGDPHDWKSADLARRIGFVFQNPEHQFVARTVAEEMRVGPGVMARGKKDASTDRRVEELLERLRLTHLVNANPFTLSGGEKRRLSVATALVAAPEVLLLDEPTFGQDPTTFAELVRMLRDIASTGTTIASITHDPAFIAALGDHRIHVKAGETPGFAAGITAEGGHHA
ncbi:ABC transporter ATP-binding protein [Corynebacterium phocae]|uniref:ABC transporter ATP-binding protein n=1 Tax=Corynebacterium phocae TaxID=161895 RepID=A0A1L7D5J7_9CORY|nr:ATP-binding cassette domain-containing protein [Corynebacterium phocae]APT93273.1 ABC transporter ATP-binding protein [Corynebacterium phocae]KAA8721597.1 ATP-binding cassette domain-containing protein [Corynebacterium phocae]